MSWDIYWESKASINQDILKIWSKEFCKKYYKEIGLGADDVILDFGAGTGDVAITPTIIEKKIARYSLDI